MPKGSLGVGPPARELVLRILLAPSPARLLTRAGTEHAAAEAKKAARWKNPAQPVAARRPDLTRLRLDAAARLSPILLSGSQLLFAPPKFRSPVRAVESSRRPGRS